MNEEEFEKLLNEFRIEVWKRKPTRTLSNKVSEEGYREIKEAAAKYGLKIGQIIEFAGWVLTNKFQPPEPEKEPSEKAERPKAGYDPKKPFKDWTREEVDEFLNENWLSKDCFGAFSPMPMHSRWFWVKMWLLRDETYDFRPAINYLEKNFAMVDRAFLNKFFPVQASRTWEDAREEIRDAFIRLSHDPEVAPEALKIIAKEVQKGPGSRGPVKILKETIKVGVPVRNSLKETKGGG